MAHPKAVWIGSLRVVSSPITNYEAIEDMRCPRCGYETSKDAQTCTRCGLAVSEASGTAKAKPIAAVPAWQRGEPAPKPTEAPPWAGGPGAAAWQTPAEYAKQPVAAEPAPRERIPEPPAPRPTYPAGLGRAASIALLVAAVASIAYGVFALTERRSIFAKLAENPELVTRDEASTSDTINVVLFVVTGVLVVVAAGFVGLWMAKLFQSAPPVQLPFGAPWWLMTGFSVLAIVVALFLHGGSDLDQIVIGYVLMGIGAILLAILALVAIGGIRSAAIRAAELALEPDVGRR